MVQKLVPKARVVVAHGQMAEKELESVMLKFIRDEADVLVATTIVENGLDIPRANTILINRADRLGLAELYQLRGRVGRSTPARLRLSPRPAGHFALRHRSQTPRGHERIQRTRCWIPHRRPRPRAARRRNMLGRQQHGHIEAIGFDMYCQMLERAVSKLKGEEVAPDLRTTLSLGFDVRIPQDYIPSENLRLRTYKRVSSIASEADKQDVRKELEDRFGKPPSSVENLLELRRPQIHV